MLVTFLQRFAPAVGVLLALPSPAGAAEVARSNGWVLDARDGERAEFCLRLSQADSQLGGGGSGTCGRAPWRQGRSELIAWVDDRELVVAGAVPASVMRAEAELVNGRRVAFDTVEGPRYRGRLAGRLRFFVAAMRAADPRDDETGGLVAVRFLGADGVVQGIAGARAYEGTRIGRPRVLLRERARGRSITVTVETQRRVAPAPGALDRIEELTCLETRSREGGSGGGGSTLCHEPGPNRPALLVVPQPGCGGVRTVVSGFVGDAVTAVRLQLGSGKVREVRTRTLLDRAGGAHRYLATTVPRGEALRSISAVGAEAEFEIGEPPSGLSCLPDTGLFAVVSYLFENQRDGAARPPGGDEQVAVEAEGHRLLVRDAEADRLCAGLDRLLADGSDCALPAAHGEDAVGRADSGIVTAVLPAEVVRVRLPDGREVPTVEGAYRGRYAGTVRFLLARARAAADARFRLLDSAGAVIGTLPVLDPAALDEEPVAGPVKLAAGRGWALSAERHRYGACTFLTVGGDEQFCFGGLPGTEEVYAAVSCSPRVAVVTGPLPRRSRGVRAVLRGGRTLRARVVTVPRRFGGGRAWVLALPRTARVKALRADGQRVRFPLLPAAEQCGYRIYAPGLFGAAVPELEMRSP
jgi:hypothetical protein